MESISDLERIERCTQAPNLEGFAQCTAQVEDNPRDRKAAECFYTIARKQQRKEEAVDYLRQYIGQYPDHPWFHHYLANTLSLGEGREPEIEKRNRIAVRLLQERNQETESGSILLVLAYFLGKVGKEKEAWQTLQQAEVLAARSDDPLLKGLYLLTKARFLRQLGANLTASLSVVQELERQFLLGNIKEPRLRINLYSTLSSVYYDLNQLDLSRAYRLKQFEQALKVGECRAATNALYNLELLRLNASLPRAENRRILTDAFEGLLAATQLVERPALEARTQHRLGMLKQGEEALHHLEACIEISERINLANVASICHARRGRLLLETSPEEAKNELKLSLVNMMRADPWQDLYGWEDRLALAKAMLPEADAREFQDRILASLENLRALQSTPGKRARFLAAWLDINDHLAGDLLISTTDFDRDGSQAIQSSPLYAPDNQLDRAFHLTESRRARVLLEKLESGVAIDPTKSDIRYRLDQVQQSQIVMHFFLKPASPLTPTEEERFNLLSDLGFDEATAKRIVQEPKSETTRRLLRDRRNTLAQRKSELERLLVTDASARPLDLVVPSLREVMLALDPQEALLLYQLGFWRNIHGDFASGSWLLAITSEGVRIYALSDQGSLEDRVTTLIGLDEEPDLAAPASLVRLYDELLGPALLDLPPGIERLTIVPDGELHNLPFDGLRPFLVALPLTHRYQISIAPSVTLWLKWRRETHARGPRTALVLAPLFSQDETFLGRFFGEVLNPAYPRHVDLLGAPPPWRDLSTFLFPSNARGFSSLKPFWNEEDGDTLVDRDELDMFPWLRPQTRSWRNSLFKPLPGTRQEAKSIRDHLGEDVELWLGRDASEERLKSTDLDRFILLHFATHALVDSVPGSSDYLAVVLAGDSIRGYDLLTVDEIEGLDLAGKVVVLSTCDSASGTRVRGEGVMSLARAFFAAGARTVVSSLKPLDDREAALLFAEFYRGLAQGLGVAGAMAQARRVRQAAGTPLSTWANLVVMGDGNRVPFRP